MNIVIEQAHKDYREDIVAIEHAHIHRLVFPHDFKEQLSDNEVSVLHDLTLHKSIQFLVALNSFNYQYWDIVEGQFLRYQHNGKVGALAAYEGFIKLWHTTPIVINESIIKKYLGNIPDMEGRVRILRESMDHFNLQLVTRIILEDIEVGVVDTNTALKVAQVMPQSFSEPYLKKIQLALYQIKLYINHFYIDKISDELTVAADYQLPKVLEALGILKYSQELTNKISNHILIDKDSKEEKALRAATILACQEISDIHNVSIPLIDRALWLARNDFPHKKFHLTKTTAY